MKKLGMFALAFALMLGLTQCKKENTTTSSNDGAKVPITLNVNGGASTPSTGSEIGSATDGSRVAVEGGTGVVTFESGDVLYVASNGVYVGTMAYNGTVFSGEINEPTEGEKLHFYFLGNKTPEFNSNNTGCSVVIDDQTEYLPVISYAPSRENYQVGKTDYNATLLNKCALVKFNVTSASEAATCIVGMNNEVIVNFSDNSFEYGQNGEGIITLPAGSGEKWAILLPQDRIDHSSAYSVDEMYSGSCGTIPAIEENGYLTNGIAVAISIPGGAIEGLFSVSATQQVYFSQGNLQYQASTNTWRFAESQYIVAGNDNNYISPTYDGWIDLFGWGTSGYNHGAVCYQPWSTSMNPGNYYAYGQAYNNLYDGNGQADWGYNAISNGGNMEGQWRTLTNDEWVYVFNTRSTTNGIRYAKATVNNVNGVVLLPDNWTASTYALNSTNNNGADFTTNTITAADWANTLEANGAVFLPAAGVREGTSVYYVGSYGYYWSASYDGSEYAYYVIFNNGLLNPYHYDFLYRSYCLSVRLVRNAE